VKRLFRGRGRNADPPDPSEEGPERVLVLDEEGNVVSASRGARETFAGLEEGARVYLDEQGGDTAEYEALRTGFTAVVSHELRTPLARLLAILESITLEGSNPKAVVEQARAEVEEMRALIDDVLFLAELESGRAVVALGPTPALPELRRVAGEYEERADRANVRILVEGDPEAALPLRPRMLRVVTENLIENALRYAGPGARFRLAIERDTEATTLVAADDGAGIEEPDLARLFERFYRSDRARASRGTGLGLAIVKHVVTAAGGTVEAAGGPGRGLTIRCRFTA